MKYFYLCFFILFFCQLLNAQFIPGNSYFGNNDYIEYIAGNLPIIITAPHGGILEPAEIPDRDCDGCVYVQDTNTEELSRKMSEAIFELFGCYPHVIINRLHRRKLDANRAIGDAADGHPLGEQAWHDFHGYIADAEDAINTNFGKGLYLDLHGHGHDIQRLELGYLISRSELQQTDEILGMPVFIDDSSIRNLVYTNLNGLSFTELLRGEHSFGEMYENEMYPSVPSQADPFPFGTEPYFSGGYNTNRYGSDDGGTIDGIQIECNWEGVRNSQADREDFAEATARVIRDYLETHYFGADFLTGECGPVPVDNSENKMAVNIFPNPVSDKLNIEINSEINSPISIFIYNNIGQLMYSKKEIKNDFFELNMSGLIKGIYFLEIINSDKTFFDKIIKE